MVNKGQVSSTVINPQDLGLTPATLAALKGGEVEENAAILTQVLQGKGTLAQTEAVALNTSLALQVGGVVPWGDHPGGIRKAKAAIADGAPWDKLQELVRFLQS
jgi:anthranilate phosphoribosyltransferase